MECIIPDTPIVCSTNALKSLKGYYHKDWNFVPMKTGDKLSLGKNELVFVEMRMLHWPARSPCSCSSRLDGGNRISSIRVAAFN